MKKIISLIKTKNLKKEKTMIHLKIKIKSFVIQMNQIPIAMKIQKFRYLKNFKKSLKDNSNIKTTQNKRKKKKT